MSDIRKNDDKGEAPEELSPTRRVPYSKYVPPVVDDEFWEDEYDDLESFEKMPKGKKNNEWR